MKHILITGQNSYIGTSFDTWMKQFEGYKIDTVGTENNEWEKTDFSNYDVIIHVAGIAHRKETKALKNLYYEVNYKLAVRVARKAKLAKVTQFIFLSTMNVYGNPAGLVKKNDTPEPNSYYGKSKWMAEQRIQRLADKNFQVAILRPPIVYGNACKGNYHKLSALASRTFIFPQLQNKRSMLFIDNLSEFIKGLMDHNKGGLFCPQNADYVCTSDLVREIARLTGKKIIFTTALNPLIKQLTFLPVLQKLFGDLYYEKEDLCHTIDFISSVKRSTSCTKKGQQQ